MFAIKQKVSWSVSNCCAAATVRRPENMAVSGSGRCEVSPYIFLTFWVLLGQAKSTIKKQYVFSGSKTCFSAWLRAILRPLPSLRFVYRYSGQVHVHVTFFPKKSYQKTLSKRMLLPARIRSGKSCKRVPEMAIK